jgi:hypothetical protein
MTEKQQDLFEKWWPRIRDVGCALFGGMLLYAQSIRSNPSETIATIGAMLLVVPAASLAQRWLRDRFEK